MLQWLDLSNLPGCKQLFRCPTSKEQPSRIRLLLSWSSFPVQLILHTYLVGDFSKRSASVHESCWILRTFLGKRSIKVLDHMKTNLVNQPAKYSTDLFSVLRVNLERTLQLSRQVMLKWKRVMSAVATKWLTVISSWHEWMFQKKFSSSKRDCNLHYMIQYLTW